MKKKIWRLSSLPTVEDLKTAIEAGIITKEEAKDMLLREEEDVPKDSLKEVKDELKLLRELVLAGIGEKEVKIIERHYHDSWHRLPYFPSWGTMYCSTANNTNLTSGTLSLSCTTTDSANKIS
jgi:hypothetical protein